MEATERMPRHAPTGKSKAAEKDGQKRQPSQPKQSWVTDVFHKIAYGASQQLGRPWAFVAALTLVIGWAATGPLFDFSETWQLVINTGTTIITFLMVFLIQSTQNRDSRALHLKLDELIVSSHARNVFADLEDASEAELDAFQAEFKQLRESGVDPTAAATQARSRVPRLFKDEQK